MQQSDHITERGFTLIELSIVLVIIGLIVGGVLTGQELIAAAGVRATISQVEKFNTAANTFYSKYGYLPGDIPAVPASQFGFAPRGSAPGQGDGNGILQAPLGGGSGISTSNGETLMFWSDLTYANGQNLNLIEGSFSSASSTVPISATATTVSTYLPAAKLGNGNFIYAYSGTYGSQCISPFCNVTTNPTTNFFGLSAVQGIGPNASSCDGCVDSVPGLTVKQAAAIDAKMDDGLPATGNVIAQFNTGNTYLQGAFYGLQYATHAAADSATTCYNSSTNKYSLTQSGGNGVNCGISFKMQAGD